MKKYLRTFIEYACCSVIAIIFGLGFFIALGNLILAETQAQDVSHLVLEGDYGIYICQNPENAKTLLVIMPGSKEEARELKEVIGAIKLEGSVYFSAQPGKKNNARVLIDSLDFSLARSRK